jgi:hypothetical protein
MAVETEDRMRMISLALLNDVDVGHIMAVTTSVAVAVKIVTTGYWNTNLQIL